MDFDRMGRRVFYKEEVAGEVVTHHKFVYDNYLCVQKLDALNNNAQINLFVWDPTEPVATRPLFTTGSGNRKFFYTCDGNKNVSELVHFETRNGIAAHYDYAPFGAVTRAISASTITDNTFTTDNPFRFSSEYHDDTLGLIYYNYRHYNPIDARWCGRDLLDFLLGQLYAITSNNVLSDVDFLGLITVDEVLAGFEAACGAATLDGWSIWLDSLKCAQAYVLTRAILQLRNELQREILKVPPDFERMRQIEQAIGDLNYILNNAYSK